MRMDEVFRKEIQNIQLARVNMKKDSIAKPISSSRITKAITKHKLWPNIKEAIIIEYDEK